MENGYMTREIHETLLYNERLAKRLLGDDGELETVHVSMEQIISDLHDMWERAKEAANQPKICLANSATHSWLIQSKYYQDGDTWYGTPIIENERIGTGQILLLNEADFTTWMECYGKEAEDAEKDEQDPDEGKPEPKEYHCRVCGKTYYDQKEAKGCMRSHEWQNRKGRR